MNDNEGFRIHREWGIDFYVCKKCNSWPPNDEPYCNKCETRKSIVVILAIAAVIAILIELFS